jgi:hypothetical protein
LIAHQTTAQRYTTGIFRITSMKTSSQTTKRVYAMRRRVRPTRISGRMGP